MNSKDMQTASEAVWERRDELWELARKIWEHPEGPFREEMAAQWAGEILEREGFLVERQAGGIPTCHQSFLGTGLSRHRAFRRIRCPPRNEPEGSGRAGTRTGGRIRPRLRPQSACCRYCGSSNWNEDCHESVRASGNRCFLWMSCGGGTDRKTFYGKRGMLSRTGFCACLASGQGEPGECLKILWVLRNQISLYRGDGPCGI